MLVSYETELDLQNDLTTTVYKFGVVADEITHTHYNSTQHELDNTQHSTTQPNKNYATQCWYTTDMTESNCNLQTCVCEYYECITCIVKKITTGQNYQASFNGHNNAV